MELLDPESKKLTALDVLLPLRAYSSASSVFMVEKSRFIAEDNHTTVSNDLDQPGSFAFQWCSNSYVIERDQHHYYRIEQFQFQVVSSQ
ncbi:hypothetical protein PanWU01x14_001540, partial [Parasponia andersonii]